MNRAEAMHYEPTGAGWLWTVRALMEPPKPAPDPHRDFPRRGAGDPDLLDAIISHLRVKP